MRVKSVLIFLTILIYILSGKFIFNSVSAQDQDSPTECSVSNPEQLTTISRVGRGLPHDIDINTSTGQIAIATALGVWVYDGGQPSQGDLLETSSPQVSVDWMADHRHLIAVDDLGNATIWDTVEKLQVSFFSLESTNQRIFGSSPVETIVAIGGFNHFQIFDVNTQRILLEPDVEGTVKLFAWSPDGSQFVTIDDYDHLQLWDAQTGNLLTEFESEQDQDVINAIAWAPDGRYLAISTTNVDAPIQIWDAQTQTHVSTLQHQTNTILALAWSRDGSQLAAGDVSGNIAVYDISSEQIITVFEEHDNQIIELDWTSFEANQIISISRNGKIYLWNVTSGRLIADMSGYWGTPNDISLSSSGNLLAIGFSNSILIWNIATQEIEARFEVSTDGLSILNALSWQSNGDDLAIANGNGLIQLLDTTSGEFYDSLPAQSGDLNDIEWSPSGNLIASAGFDGSIRIWDISELSEVLSLQGHERSVVDLSWSPDGSLLVSASTDGTVRLWDIRNGTELLSFDLFAPQVVRFSPSGHSIAVGQSTGFSIIQLSETSQDLSTWETDAAIESLTWDGFECVWLADFDGSIRLWDVQNQVYIVDIPIHSARIMNILSYESYLFTSSYDGTIQIISSHEDQE